MNIIQPNKIAQQSNMNKPIIPPIKPKKILAYTQEELKKSIERKEKRKLELQGQIQKLDQKIAERKARLQELTKKIN